MRKDSPGTEKKDHPQRALVVWSFPRNRRNTTSLPQNNIACGKENLGPTRSFCGYFCKSGDSR
jgi:hypothetical protein